MAGSEAEPTEFAHIARQQDESVPDRSCSNDEIRQADRLAMDLFAEPRDMAARVSVDRQNAFPEFAQYGRDECGCDMPLTLAVPLCK